MPPRRRATAATPVRAPSNISFADAPLTQSSDMVYVDNIQTLRRSWQWAAFSQFFYTFAQLLQMPDVLLSDVEDDLARGTSVYLPRIMTRLLVTMSLDRKLTVNNWQTGFRKQCMKRGGIYNPLGPEPTIASRNSTPDPEEQVEQTTSIKAETSVEPTITSSNIEETDNQTSVLPEKEQPLEPGDGSDDDKRVKEESGAQIEHKEPQDTNETSSQSKDWSELSMEEKLEALHTLAEWQFDNPHRLRQQMKDDGDHGFWRIEPIGYDAKTNAYWLIGPDRLWIQRSLPKPPRPAKRKRAAPAKKPKSKASFSKAVEEETESEPDVEPEARAPAKRTRTTNGRASRTKAKPDESTSSGRGARAAKLKANKMLDVQAKELAEFQRQAALLSSPSKSGRGIRSTRTSTRGQAQSSPSKRPVLGTRTSARLRGPPNDSDDEWQQVPEEWLKDERDRSPPPARRTRSKGKAKAEQEDQEVEESVAEAAGLDSDAISELTELSDDQQDPDEQTEEPNESPTEPIEPVTEPTDNAITNRKTNKAKKDIVAPEEVAEHIEYLPPPAAIPEGFVEWEAICVTLPEWVAISERFANATHYLEKALYKVLSQSVVPAVVAELREVERKRKVEEAIVHRKRSSRIALKESEKELARAEALRKAEEEDKLSRTKRLEARARKEEADREKREQAREQRRQEREARELKIANRNAPKETSSAKSSAQSTPAPSAQSRGPSTNGTTVPTPLQLSRNSTPNGVRSPDWMLDCEICGKNGINVDDGLPMVSCGSCGKWQHITCHDNADRHKGLSKRNWTTQKFLCQRCSMASNHRQSNGRHQLIPHQPPADGWTQPPTQKPIPHAPHAHAQPVSDMRYPQPVYDGRTAYGGQQYLAQPPATLYSRPQTQGYSQYQPEQRGYSAHASHSPVGWQNGYPSIPDGQRFTGTDHGAYGVPRVASPYTNPAIIPTQSYARDPQPYSRPHDVQGYPRMPEVQSYNRPHEAQPFNRSSPYNTPNSNGHWNHTPNGYHAATSQRSASHLSAAESLAFMQESAQPHQGWQNPSYAQQSSTNGVHLSNPSPAPLHHSHASMSLGHGPPYQFPAS